MFQKILVPLDGSQLAEQALEPALTLADLAGGEVLLLSVTYLKHMFAHDQGHFGFLLPEQSIENTRQELEVYLQSLKETHAQLDVELRTKVLEGDEAGVILDTAVAQEIDLIVMSTHGRTGFSRWYLGSVTEKVLRSSPCPVLVIREEQPVSRVLITLDGSELSEKALKPGFEVARRFDASVTLLGVESGGEINHSFISELDSVEHGLGEKVRDEFYHRTEMYLQRTAQKFQPESDQKIQIVPKIGPVAESILNYIESAGVDLVVMSTHGRTGLRRWVYGSITEKVLHRARCALMIIRPPAEQLTR
jgi:nucleotide-binding universal stress UspA family protein